MTANSVERVTVLLRVNIPIMFTPLAATYVYVTLHMILGKKVNARARKMNDTLNSR